MYDEYDSVRFDLLLPPAFLGAAAAFFDGVFAIFSDCVGGYQCIGELCANSSCLLLFWFCYPIFGARAPKSRKQKWKGRKRISGAFRDCGKQECEYPLGLNGWAVPTWKCGFLSLRSRRVSQKWNHVQCFWAPSYRGAVLPVYVCSAVNKFEKSFSPPKALRILNPPVEGPYVDPIRRFHFLLKLAQNAVEGSNINPQNRVSLASFKSIYVWGIEVEGVSWKSTTISRYESEIAIVVTITTIRYDCASARQCSGVSPSVALVFRVFRFCITLLTYNNSSRYNDSLTVRGIKLLGQWCALTVS